jgi:hypothetical protein
MAKLLKPAQVAAYDDDGFVFPIDVLTPDEAADYRARLETLEAGHGKTKYGMKPYLTMTLADELAHTPRLLDAVEDLIGPNLLLWDGAFIIKEPQTENFISWHQDLTYWGVGPADQIVSIWLALSPVMAENGCMAVAPGSHRDGIRSHADRFEDDNMLSRGQEIADEFDQESAVDVVLKPGQMSLHHGHVIHGSNPNRSDQRRIGLNLQFIVPSVRQSKMKNDSAMLVRGRDDHQHFAPEPRPIIDFAMESVAFADDIGARRQEMLFRGTDKEKQRRYSAAV